MWNHVCTLDTVTGNLAVISRFHHFQINERYDFFSFFETLFCTKLPLPLPWWSKISWWRICRWRAVNLEIHLWSFGVTAFGDRPASTKFSASVNSDLWVWSYPLTSDLRDVYFLDMHSCLAMVVSESSFGVYVCLRRPAGLHRNQRSCGWHSLFTVWKCHLPSVPNHSNQ